MVGYDFTRCGDLGGGTGMFGMLGAINCVGERACKSHCVQNLRFAVPGGIFGVGGGGLWKNPVKLVKLLLKSFGNSYSKFVILDIKFRFTCGKSDLY